MTRKELEKELGYGTGMTSIQREVKCQTLIGKEIDIIDEISDISETYISLMNNNNEDAFQYDILYYTLYYNKERFREQLMVFSGYDGVKIKALIKKNTTTSFEFELLSIQKIYSHSDSEKTKIKARRKS